MESQDMGGGEGSDGAANTSQPWKRKYPIKKSENQPPAVLKKARYTWQIKGQSGLGRLPKVHEYTDESQDAESVSQSIIIDKMQSDGFQPECTGSASPSKKIRPENESAVQDANSSWSALPGDSNSGTVVGKFDAGTQCLSGGRNIRAPSESYENSTVDGASSLSPLPQLARPGPLNTGMGSQWRAFHERYSLPVHSQDQEEPLDSYERWRKHNTAGAIVDNVFNKTLEEMGLSPDHEANTVASERSQVENLSIAQAIWRRGLVSPGNCSVSAEWQEEGTDQAMQTLAYHQHTEPAGNTAARTTAITGQATDPVVNQLDPDPSHNQCNSRLDCDRTSSRPAGCESNSITGSSNILDLAVSTAIWTTGLSVRKPDSP